MRLESIAQRLWIEAEMERRRGNVAQALQLYDEINEVDPGFSPAWTNKGGLLAQAGRYREAAEALGQGLLAEPQNGQAHNNLGQCYHQLKQHAKAIECYQKAIQSGYRHGGVHYNIAAAYIALNDLNGALDAWEQALRVNPVYEPLLKDILRLGMSLGAVKARDLTRLSRRAAKRILKRIRRSIATGDFIVNFGPGGLVSVTRQRTHP
jgi:tetratricopeptide (TPR) repeat protein